MAVALPAAAGRVLARAFLFAGENDLIIGARKGSRLAIGYGDGEMYLGSDCSLSTLTLPAMPAAVTPLVYAVATMWRR